MSSEEDYSDEYEEELEWMEQKRYMIEYFIERIDEIKERGSLNDEEYIAKVHRLLRDYLPKDTTSHERSILTNLDALYKRIL